MSAKRNKLNRPYMQQLSDLSERLQGQINEEGTLGEIHRAIRALLSDNDDSERDIRSILRKQFENGNLREETFELVEQMLDRMVEQDSDSSDEDTAEVPTITEASADETLEVPTIAEDETVIAAAEDVAETVDRSETEEVPFVDTTVLDDDVPSSPADERLQIGSVLRDRFLLQEQVDGGSMGVVYKALDRRLAEANSDESYVAIKVLSPQLARNGNALRALQQEAAKGRYLSHPNIVRFIDLDREDDLYFIVMEWLDGRSLAEILDDSGNKLMDLPAALDIVRQVGEALEHAHKRGVVHADVKPANIMMLPSGKAKLFDFGVARIRQKQAEGEPDAAADAFATGTPAYSSMQVLTGEDPVPADDVFSLACLLYRLVAGYRVFGPRDAAMAATGGMEPQRPQGFNDTQWKALRKALSFSRVTRFSSPAAFLEALDAPMNIVPSHDDTIVDGFDDEHRKSPWRIALIVVVILGSLAVVATKTGLVDDLPFFGDESTPPTEQTTDAGADEAAPIDPAAPPVQEAGPGDEAPTDTAAVAETLPEAVEPPLGESEPVAEGSAEPTPDDSDLPPPTVSMTFGAPGVTRAEVSLTLREDSDAATVEFVRTANLGEPLSLRLEEVGFSGNRSPWESGQYQVSDDALVTFAPGQDRARAVISMASDPLREPDRQVSLLVRDVENAESEYAFIHLGLEDDDQRTFEAGLAPNTVAFAVSQVSVRESDPAVQVDVIRFKPDNTALDIEYVVRDVTAVQGEDYFSPGLKLIAFGPGQRTARVLIPLVQDSDKETDEAFMLELQSENPQADVDIFLRIAVMIRDDDS